MNRKIATVTMAFLSFLFLILWLTASIQAQEHERRVDDPEDREDLNRELWEFARNSSYEDILDYVKVAQSQSHATERAEIDLPNGWRLAPAGAQIQVGHLPYEVVSFAGRLVVLNNGYYYKEPAEVSVVNPDTKQIVKTIKIKSLFAAAQVGLDGDLYISGGFEDKIFRIDKDFNIKREYEVPGYGGGLAA